MQIEKLLNLMVTKDASDLHLRVPSPPSATYLRRADTAG